MYVTEQGHSVDNILGRNNVLFILFIFYSKNSQNSNLSLK